MSTDILSPENLAKLRAKVDRLQEWFDSAMVMVDNVPLGIAWSDPQQNFVITYMNVSGRTMLDGVAAEKGASLVEKRLTAVFPPLSERLPELSDPTRLRIVALLERDELSVAELQEITRLGQSRISTHLGLLQ